MSTRTAFPAPAASLHDAPTVPPDPATADSPVAAGTLAAVLRPVPASPWRHAPAVAVVLGAHLLLGGALLQVPAVRHTLGEVAPLMVEMITPDTPPAPLPPPPPPPAEPPRPRPVSEPPPVIAAAPVPSPAPPAFTAPPPPPEPAAAPAPPAVVAVPAPPAPPQPPAPPAAPRLVPATAVQYVQPPRPEYPLYSRRLREQGTVQLRVLIDEQGRPRQIVIDRSSGFPRLDDAAVAAMKAARFKPYTDNGQPQPVWAPAPIAFDLEN